MGLCANPYMVGSIPCSCYNCFACRINRARVWSHRILLETLKNEFNSFLTLTYSDDNLPKNGGVKYEDAKNFIKRLRQNVGERKIRYYLCGEYGSQTRRPHYHAALFGISPLENVTVEKSWGLGNIYLGELTPQSASYVAGYVQKKLDKSACTFCNHVNGERNNKICLKCGMEKEFTKMSLKPGIGAEFMKDVGNSVKTLEDTSKYWNGDVPNVLRHSGKLWPIGRYLRGKLREAIGRTKDTPLQLVEGFAKDLSKLYGEYVENEKNEEVKRFLKAAGKKSFNTCINKQKLLNLKSRSEIFGQRRNKI